jgi:hypothetical protein
MIDPASHETLVIRPTPDFLQGQQTLITSDYRLSVVFSATVATFSRPR